MKLGLLSIFDYRMDYYSDKYRLFKTVLLMMPVFMVGLPFVQAGNQVAFIVCAISLLLLSRILIVMISLDFLKSGKALLSQSGTFSPSAGVRSGLRFFASLLSSLITLKICHYVWSILNA